MRQIEGAVKCFKDKDVWQGKDEALLQSATESDIRKATWEKAQRWKGGVVCHKKIYPKMGTVVGKTRKGHIKTDPMSVYALDVGVDFFDKVIPSFLCDARESGVDVIFTTEIALQRTAKAVLWDFFGAHARPVELALFEAWLEKVADVRKNLSALNTRIGADYSNVRRLIMERISRPLRRALAVNYKVSRTRRICVSEGVTRLT